MTETPGRAGPGRSRSGRIGCRRGTRTPANEHERNSGAKKGKSFWDPELHKIGVISCRPVLRCSAD